MEAAVDFLRKKGLATAAKKAGRAATEGLAVVTVLDGGKRVSAVEVNCETDFVGKNEDFIGFVKDVGELAAASDESITAEALLTKPFPGKYFKEKGTVQDALTNLIAKVGENMSFRRAKSFQAKGTEGIGSYVHGNGRVAVLLKARFKGDAAAKSADGQALLKDLCMQVAAARPEFLDAKDVTGERLEREKEIFRQQAIDAGKPREIAEKMVSGKLTKLYAELCLRQQPFIKEPDVSVEKIIEKFNKAHQEDVTLVDFVRFGLGEGLDKKKDDFAAEVAAMQKK
jgi:elongation factor Ts